MFHTLVAHHDEVGLLLLGDGQDRGNGILVRGVQDTGGT